jgi:hemolysin activation/secretion protein
MGAVAALAMAGVPNLGRAASEADSPSESAPAASTRRFDINEYRVEGAAHLSTAELESVLARFTGPNRQIAEVEQARVALEKFYSDKGYQSVAVAIPPQTVRSGVVALQVTEPKVGRVRVHGARWFSPAEVRAKAPSLAEGVVPNFNDIVRDITALNQLADRRVTPALRAGAVPGTVDVDLNVQDTFPLHGSLEVNNRYGSATTHTRLSGSLHYDNLWQLGHSLTFSFQVAPRRLNDAKIFSASYLARIPSIPWLSFLANAVNQDSDVSTLGGISVAGRGRIAGARALFTLPGSSGFFQTLTTGLDYKRFVETISLTEGSLLTPVTYWPVTTQYSASLLGESAQTQASVTAVFNLRALSRTEEFDDKRFKASGNFIYFRGDFSRTDNLPLGLQLTGRFQGQYCRDPLISSEQFAAGGADTVRGYLEGQAAGDYAAIGSVELRGPSMAELFGGSVVDDWRLLAFAEGGWIRIHETLPDQNPRIQLWSMGGGTRIKLLERLNGSLDVAVPLRSEGTVQRFKPRFLFRVWTEF